LERNWHPTQRETNLPGGAVEVTFALSDLNDVTRWILGFGSDVEVIEPAELRATIAAEGTKMAQRNAP
jgi:predicted DNA-binding transcriptional regulator YafY